jgi:hypothetical protein
MTDPPRDPRPSGRRSSPRDRRARIAGILAVLVTALACDLLACRTAGVAPVAPVAPRASLAFAEGRELAVAGDLVAARAAYAEAARLAPDWAAPARALDDLDRDALLGPDLYARRRAELAEHETALALYLVGRLEGSAGVGRFERGIDLDHDLAWNHHGLAWNLYASGSARAALRPGRRALEAARDTWEQSYFTIALARYELALGHADRAAELLGGRLADADVLRIDRPPLEAWLAQAEMLLSEPGRSAQGRRRALALVSDPTLPDEDLARLVATLANEAVPARRWGRPPAGGVDGEAAILELASALAARDDRLARRLRAGLLFDLERPALALALLEADGADPLIAQDPSVRIARFARGAGRKAIADWVTSLPAFLKDADGRPLDPALAELARAAGEGDDRELASALLAAGWFAEAHAFAEDMAPRDPEAALALEARASAGRVLVGGVGRVLELVDRGEPHGGALAKSTGGTDPAIAGPRFTAPQVIGSIDGLLDALEPLFVAYHRSPEGAELPPVALRDSPRVGYGPAATVVHPGPVYSRADADRGIGVAGEPVAGLAAELDAIGRFGIFGDAVGGGGPDGTLLRRVLLEERSGEHLGVPWTGLVAWCDGADVESRPGRRGARISGAALHEGYWVDLDVVRGELAAWRALEQRFFGPDAAPDAAERALGVAGAPVSSALGVTPGTPVALLGEAERVRLAVLSDRSRARASGHGGDLVTLDELVRLTALHEEGHLCDRTRFLPLGRNLGAALAFLLDAGLTPSGVARALEERAQLVALCVAPDPRIPLADVLSAAENGSTVTPHAAAYESLLERWLGVLEDQAADAGRFPALDRGRAYAHQLHELSPEEVRAVSLELADRRGLVR